MMDWYVTNKGKIRPVRWWHRLWWRLTDGPHGVYEYRYRTEDGSPLYFCKDDGGKWIMKASGQWYLQAPEETSAEWVIDWKPD